MVSNDKSAFRPLRLRRAGLWLAAGAFVAACSAAPASGTPSPVAIVGEQPPEQAAASAQVTEDKSSAADVDDAGASTLDERWEPGRRVRARGRLSKTPWQHMMGHVAGKRAEYFDLSTGGQTVVYVAKPLECPATVEVEATVIEVSGESKRPGKAGEGHRELHLDVQSHSCIP